MSSTNHPEEAFHQQLQLPGPGRLLDPPVGAIGGGNLPSMLLGTTSEPPGSHRFFIMGYKQVLPVDEAAAEALS